MGWAGAGLGLGWGWAGAGLGLGSMIYLQYLPIRDPQPSPPDFCAEHLSRVGGAACVYKWTLLCGSYMVFCSLMGVELYVCLTA